MPAAEERVCASVSLLFFYPEIVIRKMRWPRPLFRARGDGDGSSSVRKMQNSTSGRIRLTVTDISSVFVYGGSVQFRYTPFFFNRLLRKMIFFEHSTPSHRPVRVFISLKNRHHTDETQDRPSFFLTKKEQFNKLSLSCSTLSNLLIDKLL